MLLFLGNYFCINFNNMLIFCKFNTILGQYFFLKCSLSKKQKIMKNRVILILKTFSAEDIRKFNTYLNSPYFNRSNKIRKLFNEIINFSPVYDSPKLNYKYLNSKVSPERPYNSITMRRLIADLEKHAVNFLKQINLENDELGTHYYLRTELQTRSLTKFFEDSIVEFEGKFAKEEVIDENYFMNKLNLETDKLNYSYISKNISRKVNVNSLIMYLVTGSKYLFLYFVIKMVSYYLNLYSMEANFKDIQERNSLHDFLIKFFNGFDNFYLKEFLKDEQNDYYFVYDIYFSLFKAFSEKKGIVYYEHCKKLLNTYNKLFKLGEKEFLYGKLMDFCRIRQNVNVNDEYSQKELLKLYELVISKKYYETENFKYLQVPLFRNIVNFAIRIKKYKWAEKFIKIYSNKLYPDFKNDLKNISYARLMLNRGQYTETLRYLSKTNPEGRSIKLDYKNLQVMVHYELGNYETVMSMLSSYRNVIRRSGVVTKENKILYRNFINYTESFIRFMNNRNKSYIDSLTDRINKTEKVVNKAWLQAKVKELASEKSKAA